LCKIPLHQAIQEIPIYAKTIKEFCTKNPTRKIKVTPTIHVAKTLSDLLLCRDTLVKYEDPGNPIVTIKINGCSFPNVLVDLGAAINVLTTTTCERLGITALDATTTLVELADQLIIKLEGTLQDVMMSVDSWEYPTHFLIINPRNRLGGHPLILGISWLATVDAYISCQTGSMNIERGNNVKNLYLYPLAQPSLTIIKTRNQTITYLTEKYLITTNCSRCS